MLEKQGLDPIAQGDCVFLYTGHGDLWHPTEWDSYDAAEKTRRIGAFNAGERLSVLSKKKRRRDGASFSFSRDRSQLGCGTMRI